jgi:hypothetical protein
MICFLPKSHAQKGKSEISVGYGFYSFYSFVNHGLYEDGEYRNSSGSLCVNYRYYLTRNVTLGLGFGYENISNWGSFVTFAPEVTATYLDTRNTTDIRVRLYGSFSYGVSIFEDAKAGDPNHFDESGAKPWAFQGTPFGIRIGRQFAGFCEIGLGYKGLVHGGIELRFPRMLAHREHVVD